MNCNKSFQKGKLFSFTSDKLFSSLRADFRVDTRDTEHYLKKIN